MNTMSPYRSATPTSSEILPHNLHQSSSSSSHSSDESTTQENRERLNNVHRSSISSTASPTPRRYAPVDGTSGAHTSDTESSDSVSSESRPNAQTRPDRPAEKRAMSRQFEDDSSSDVSESGMDDIPERPDFTAAEKRLRMTDEVVKALMDRVIGNTSRIKHQTMREIAEREDQAIKTECLRKYAGDFLAGAVTQGLSFAPAGAVSTLAGNPWLFAVIAPILSDCLAERMGQLARGSTISIPETQQWLQIQRQVGRALGDVIASYCGKTPKKKFSVTVNGETRPATASEALKACGPAKALNAFGRNFLVRGLPFLWFSAIYTARDFGLLALEKAMAGSSGAAHLAPTDLINQTMPADLTNITASLNHTPNALGPIDPQALRWAVVIIAGLLAGGMTALTSQLIASMMPGNKEATNYSTEYYAARTDYLQSLKADIKTTLSQLNPHAKQYRTQVQQLHDLETWANEELTYAERRSSRWTALQAEFARATEKHRDKTNVATEIGGNRVDFAFSMLGKFMSLLTYAYCVSRFSGQGNGTSEQDKVLGAVLVPLSLIILGGYAFRDEMRLVGRVPYGLFKGVARATQRAPGTDIAPLENRSDSSSEVNGSGEDGSGEDGSDSDSVTVSVSGASTKSSRREFSRLRGSTSDTDDSSSV